MPVPTFTLRTVTSGGVVDQMLPDLQTLTVTPVFNAAGSMQFTYPENGKNFALLQNDLEIAVLVDGVEILEMRSRIESTEGDNVNVAEDGYAWTYTTRTMLGRTDEAKVYPPLWPDASVVTCVYSNTPGFIIADFIDKAHSRGTLNWLSYDFTTTHDSNGVAWPSNLDMTYDVGMTYSDVWKSLTDLGVVEVRVMGRTMQAFIPGSIGTDKSTGSNPLRFMKGRDLTESDRKSSTRDLSTVVLIAGANGLYQERTSGFGPIVTWGRRESYGSYGNIATTGGLDVVGDSLAAVMDQPVLSVTHTLVFENSVNPQPMRDFGIGDWALTYVGGGWERYRIVQWVIQVAQDGTTNGTVTLNGLIAEQLLKVNLKVNALNNGSAQAGASASDTDDGRPPAQPATISLSSDLYTTFNQTRATINVGWSVVTTNSDGTPATDIQGYSARWRYASDSSIYWRATVVTNSGAVGYIFDNVNESAPVVVQVECHDKFGHTIGFTGDHTITTAHDGVAPEAPSAPILTSNVGTLRVYWDGLDDLGAAQVSDFAGVEVHISTGGPSFTPVLATKLDFLTSPTPQATTITTGLVYGTQYWGKLVAIDTSGNKSIASAAGTATLNQVVNVEIGTGQVGLANTLFSDVGNLVDDGSFESAVSRTSRATAFAGTHYVFDNATASNSTWSLRHDSWAGGAVVERFPLQGALPVKPGERVFGAADYRVTSSIPVGSLITLGIKWLDPSGNYLDSTGAINNVTYTLADSSLTTADNIWHTRIAGTSQVAPLNVATMEIWLVTANRTAGTIWIDAVEIRRQIDTLLIGDAAITTAKIANLAVNNAKINDLSVGKLTTGTLGADIVVGARIKTANTGARVELNASGLQAYDASSNQTVSISSSTGDAVITGQFQSGLSSDRVIVNPPSTTYPTIQFYPTSGSNYTALYSRGDVFSTEATYFISSGTNAAGTRSATYEHAAGLVYTYITNVTTGLGGGGSIQLNTSEALLDYDDASGNGGTVVLSNSNSVLTSGPSTSAQVQVGLDRTTRFLYFQGRFANFTDLGPTPAVFCVSQVIGVASSSAWGYGSTQSDGKAIVASLFNGPGVIANCVTGSSATGFTFSSASNGGSASRVFAWIFGY